MNKHFFERRSTLSYIAKLRAHNYAANSPKTIRFCYLIERRLIVVLARMYITRIKAKDQLQLLITAGYVSVDNEIIMNPLYLTRAQAILRVVKSIPRVFSRVPKTTVLSNLLWLYRRRLRRYLRAKKKNKTRFKVRPRPRPWFFSRVRRYPLIKRVIKLQGKKVRVVFDKRRQFRRYRSGEPRRRRGRDRRSSFRKLKARWLHLKLVMGVRAFPRMFYAQLEKTHIGLSLAKGNKKNWLRLLALAWQGPPKLSRRARQDFKGYPANRYSRALLSVRGPWRRFMAGPR
jgi:hypothetical protein